MHEDVFSMTVNRKMLNYFSQQSGRIDPESFVAIYCLNPLGDDDCPVGICPNPDIAGVLVRTARMFCLVLASPTNGHLTCARLPDYITAFCLSEPHTLPPGYLVSLILVFR